MKIILILVLLTTLISCELVPEEEPVQPPEHICVMVHIYDIDGNLIDIQCIERE